MISQKADNITTSKQRKPEPCAYFIDHAVHVFKAFLLLLTEIIETGIGILALIGNYTMYKSEIWLLIHAVNVSCSLLIFYKNSEYDFLSMASSQLNHDDKRGPS